VRSFARNEENERAGVGRLELLQDPREVLSRVEVRSLLAPYQRLYAFSPQCRRFRLSLPTEREKAEVQHDG
jgi:hypothetical protein